MYDFTHHHGQHNLAGYLVEQTYRDGALLSPFVEVQRIDGAHLFGAAIAAADAIRRAHFEGGYPESAPVGERKGGIPVLDDWAVVRPIYACGCVGEAY